MEGEEWKSVWDQPDYQHRRPKLSRRDSVEFFTTLLDLYSSLVNGYEKMILHHEYAKYSGCSLHQLFDCEGFLAIIPKSNQPFIKEFLSTQLFSNLVTSRIEVSSFPSSSFLKSLLDLLQLPLLHVLGFGLEARGILNLRPGVEATPSALEGSLTHWTAREGLALKP